VHPETKLSSSAGRFGQWHYLIKLSILSGVCDYGGTCLWY